MDRRKRKTRESIIKTFYTILAQENFEQVTVSKICQLADINRGTFYLHFLDKYDLLEQIIKEEVTSITDYCRANEERVDHLTATLEYLLSKKQQFKLLMKADGQGIFSQQLAGYLLAEEQALPQVEAIFIANGLVGVLTFLVTTEESSGEIIKAFTKFLAKHQNFME